MIEKMGIDQNAPLINLLYSGAAPTQYVRELVQNGLDAKASYIELGIDHLAAQDGGPKRLQYRDNGCGMSPEELRVYFNHLSASSGTLEAHGNYGIGAKISLLPWNHAGVVIMSWDDGPDSGAAIHIVWENGEYGLKVFQAQDDDGDWETATVIRAEPEYCPSWVSDPTDPAYIGTGTVVICLGATGMEDTYYGPPIAEKGATLLTRQINSRYFDFGGHVTVRCWEDTADGGKLRTATGTKAFLIEHSRVDDFLVLSDGTIVHWFILDEARREQTTGRHSHTGFIGALYRDERTGATEVYNTTRIGGETFHRMRLFGITEPKIQKRLVLLVEAPRANGIIGVRPNASRSSLDYTGTDDRSLPWATWGPEFAAQLPSAIEALLEAARGENGPKRNMREKLRHLLERMRHPAYRVDDTGNNDIKPDVPGRSEPSSTGKATTRTARAISPRAPKTPIANVLSESGTKGKEFNPKLDPPAVEWRSENEEGYEEVLRDRAVSYDWQAPGLVIMNRDFFVFREEMLFWRDQFPHASSSTIQGVIEEEYEAVVVASVMHAWTRKGAFKWTPKHWEQLVDPISLTTACLGFHLESKIRRALAGKVGKTAS